MQLLGKRVIFREIKATEKKQSLIVVPDEKQEYYNGEILALGTETKFHSGMVGKTLLISTQMADPFEWNGEKCYICLEEHIIAVQP